MKQIENKLQEAVFDHQLVENKKNKKISAKEGFEHDNEGKMTNKFIFTGHSTTADGVQIVKPKPPPGTMLINEQLKSMKGTLKSI